MVTETESSDTDQWPAGQPSEAESPIDDGTATAIVEDSNQSAPAGARSRRCSETVKSYSCEQCALTFRKRDDLDRHRFSHTGVREYPCTVVGCGKEYTNRTHLNRHIRANHKEKPAVQETVRCKHSGCEKTFSSEQSMRRHYQVQHIHGKSWSCQECGEKFWRKLQLKQHSFKHTGEYPHKCDFCERGFINLKALRHHRTTHALYQCDTCMAEFVRWTELVAHKKLQHAVLYQCEVCSGKFPSKRNLKMHVKVHQRQTEGDKREVFQCTYEGCPKFYDYERNLVAHIASKHKGTREFVCPVPECARVLSTKQKLAQHSKMHESAARVVAKMKVPGKPAAHRKDTGIPKRSTASRLANIKLDAQTERLLIDQSPERRPQIELECSFSMESASESEQEIGSKVGSIVEMQLQGIQAEIRRMKEEEAAKG